jgi:DNA polymerase elongation subunit (family B)
MSYSNIYFDRYKSEIHYWEYSKGVRYHKVAPAPLYFYVENNGDEETEYKTIFDKPAEKIEFNRWGKYRDAKEKYKEWGRRLYESDVPIETKFIIDNYSGINLEMPEFDIHYMDIEVHSEDGFPRPEDAKHPVTIITTWSTKHKKFFIFAEQDFDDSFITNLNEECEKKIFKHEVDLITYYFDWVREEQPDIMTGWNSNGYDIPYLMNRARKIIGEDFIETISPVGYVKERMIPITETREEGRWTIGAINTLDMLEIYQNYTFSQQESWKLDHIAEVEIGEKKIEYEGTIADLYKDWQKYVEYNVQDVRLLRKLEDKKKFIPLLVTFCYGCRVPFEQYQKTTRVLDGAFISSLSPHGIVLPDVNRDIEGSVDYVGGFVKEPIHGLHDWVVSFDATSLYPSIMMNLNISPETKLGKIPDESVKYVMAAFGGKEVNESINFSGEKFDCNEFIQFMKDGNYCISANGVVYSQNEKGIIPRFVEEWFLKRKEFKKKMLAAQAQGNKDDADKYHNLQLNFKILINSVYGYLGTKHSRFFDKENAIAVTLTGQYITKSTAKAIDHHFTGNGWLNSKMGKKIGATETTDGTVIYADTDSVYIDFGNILKTFQYDYETESPEVVKNFIIYNEKKTNEEMGIHLDMEDEEIGKFAQMEEKSDSIQNHVSNLINTTMKRLMMVHFNADHNRISFKREAVASRGIFLEKKRYVLWALNNEGVELPDKKKLKVTGIDIIRSNTPKFVKKELKDVIINILKHVNYEETVSELRDIHERFWDAVPSEIAFMKSANGVVKWSNRRKAEGKFKSTPQHVRGAILYNEYLDEHSNLKNHYDKIYDGDKVCVLYMKKGPNWDADVFVFKEKWVKESGFEEYIDRRRQFEVSMVNPVKKFFDSLKWQLPDFENNDMSGLFEW